jgi:hypothetical protein
VASDLNANLERFNRWYFQWYVEPFIGITIDQWRLLDRERRNALLEEAWRMGSSSSKAGLESVVETRRQGD